MKWVFKYEYKEIEAQQSLVDVMMQIQASQLTGSIPNITPKIIKIRVGGHFEPSDGKTNIELTDPYIFNKYRDQQKVMMNWLSSYIGNNTPIGSDEFVAEEEAYLGKWSPELEKNVKLYYFIQDGNIHKLFICDYTNYNLELSGITGNIYIMEYKGKMMDMIPEDGDIIYDSYDEAMNDKERID